MKKILITGANSYIGTSVADYLMQWPDKYAVDIIDMIDGSWREKSFHGYDSVFHVAGIAHQKETKKNSHLYYAVNRDLAVETARKTKAAGVGQFIFLSSMSVYGMNTGVITQDTIPQPKTNYGKSKLQAEKGILEMQDEGFRACILRPPMVYGKGCKGNYQTLVKLAIKLPIFPDIDNCRSMLYIEILCAFVRLMIENEERGVFFPQNAEYTRTSDMVRMIAAAHGKTLRLTKAFKWMLPVLSRFTGLVDKGFGSLVYEIKISEYKTHYRNFTLSESISQTEGYVGRN